MRLFFDIKSTECRQGGSMLKTERILLTLFLPRTKGQCIAHLRNILQLTQNDISKELGLSRTSISKMENGDMSVSESVWRHIIYLVYANFDLHKTMSFNEFKQALELCLEEDEGGEISWKEKNLLSAQEMNI